MSKVTSYLKSNSALKTYTLIFFILSILILSGCSSSKNKLIPKSKDVKNNSPNIEQSKANLEISEDEIMQTIYDIATEKRVLGTTGEKNAASFLKNKMEGYGYNIEFQDFEVFKLEEDDKNLLYDEDINVFLDINPLNRTQSRGIARNVIARPKNFDKNKKTLYIVSHYDTTTATTGVYDNATGVSSVVELARVLQNYDNPNLNLEFIFFSAEEYFKMGSRFFISQLSNLERSNILGAINIDMIGYTGFKHLDFPEIGDIEILLTPWVKKDALETLFNNKFNNKYNVNNEMGGMSDDISFSRLNVPTLYFADKHFATGFEIEEENFDTQLKPVNVNTISNLCKDIYSFIKNFDINTFNKLNSIPDEEKGIF